jgi:uncharacterized protein YjbI with pentapeptide repeats
VLDDAQIAGTLFGSAATSRGLTQSQIYSTASYRLRDLRNIGLEGSNLSGWDLRDQNLAGANFESANLSTTNLSRADLSDANLKWAQLSQTVLTDAVIRGTQFGLYADTRGLTSAQFYSTTSYKNRNLVGIGLELANLSGWDLHDQNLASANLRISNLTGANLERANLATGSLERANLTGANLADSVLNGVNLQQAILTGADLHSARLLGASLQRASLVGANLTDADFSFADLSRTILSGADLRGATLAYATLDGIQLSNVILPDGTVAWVSLPQHEGNQLLNSQLLVRDYDGQVPIVMEGSVTIQSGGELKLLLDDGAWDSTVAFAPNTNVELGGRLVLDFAAEVLPATQVGRTFDLFDWSEAQRTGVFAVVTQPQWRWDLSQLYTTGEVTLLAVPEPAIPTFWVVTVVGWWWAVRRGRASVTSDNRSPS